MGISDDLDKTAQLEYFYEYFPDRVAQYTAVFNQLRKNKRKETRANKVINIRRSAEDLKHYRSSFEKFINSVETEL